MPVLIRALLVSLLAAPALADDASDKAIALNKEGTALAEQGKHAEAIERFKAAEALLPRYQHHCNIGIAYQDSGKQPQALLFLQSCVARAGKNASPASKSRLAALEAKLKSAPYGVLVVTGEQTRVAVAPWNDEEWVVDGSRRFVLEAGAVSLVAKRRDGSSWSQPVVVEAGKVVTVALVAPPEPEKVEPVTVGEPMKPVEPTTVAAPVGPRPIAPWIVTGAGAVLVGLGVVTLFLAGEQIRRFTPSTTETELTGYRALVVTTYSAWGLGALGIVGGVLWGLLGGSGGSNVSVVPVPAMHGGVLVSFSGEL